MAVPFLRITNRVFDAVENRWESHATQRRVATTLIVIFLAGMVIIELNRRGWLPSQVGRHLPMQHWYAIVVAFTVLLLAEVVSLVLVLAQSVSSAIGKQLEIMSLILIRFSFKELTYFEEPIVWDNVTGEVGARVLCILSDAVGALVIFALLVVFNRMQRHQMITRDEGEQASFVTLKKAIALILLGALVIIAVEAVVSQGLSWEATNRFFQVFYTLMIFADVLVVLTSLRFSAAYTVVFRYFGFAVATILIRLALTAPQFVDAALGIVATLYAIALTWAYNRAVSDLNPEADAGAGSVA